MDQYLREGCHKWVPHCLKQYLIISHKSPCKLRSHKGISDPVVLTIFSVPAHNLDFNLEICTYVLAQRLALVFTV